MNFFPFMRKFFKIMVIYTEIETWLPLEKT